MNFLAPTLLLLHFILYCRGENATYTTKYDGVNLEEILENQRLLTGYINCLLDQGPCTPDGKELKKNLPDAIDNNCRKCSEKQRTGSEMVMHYIIDNRPDDWNELEKKYNADGSYKRKYLIKKGINKSHEEENVMNPNNSKEDKN